MVILYAVAAPEKLTAKALLIKTNIKIVENIIILNFFIIIY
tara:strand:- start:860 stop:982 length:123 start_codon:yes stop_codon:yes gene_type:complete